MYYSSTNYKELCNYKPRFKDTSENNAGMIFSIAEWFLAKESMSNKKLQKLCYYAYCWCIVMLDDLESPADQLICKDGFEAWIHGPVCRTLYGKYKAYGWDLIPKFQGNVCIPHAVVEVLKQVWYAYGELTADQLESLTHSEAPWIEARKNVDYDQISRQKISVKTIFNFYSKQLADE